MNQKTLIDEIISHIDDIVTQKDNHSKELWYELLMMHPADSAQLCTYLSDQQLAQLFPLFPQQHQLNIFKLLPESQKERILEFLTDEQKAYFFSNIPLDDLTDLFDDLSDEELKKSLNILHKKNRQKVLSLLKFAPDSAGGIMNVDFLMLEKRLTVGKSIAILQRLKPNVNIHRQLYVVDEAQNLVGYIYLEDLVIRSPHRTLEEIIKQVPYVALATEDQEQVAKQMVHYHMMTVPVVNEHHKLLGIIPEDTLIDIIQQEAQEDAQRMSGTPLTKSYFEMSVFQLFYQRSFILAILLGLESITSLIVHQYEAILTQFLIMFFAMLVSTGGNTSGQTSTIAIQGMSSGDINQANMGKFLRREMLIGTLLAIFLSCVAFMRVYYIHGDLTGSIIVSISLGLIVLLSVIMGASFPILLQKFGIDPAFSAGPFLATLMDILGIFIYCYIAYLILG